MKFSNDKCLLYINKPKTHITEVDDNHDRSYNHDDSYNDDYSDYHNYDSGNYYQDYNNDYENGMLVLLFYDSSFARN